MWDLYINLLKKSVVVFFVLLLGSSVFAIEEVSSNESELNNNAVEMQTKTINGNLVFNDILEKAQNHSYDLKIADFAVLIVAQDIRGARSEYFPKLYFSASTEYNKNFQDKRSTPTTYVGDTYVNQYTRYQSVLGFTLAYNLFDFGVRKGILDISKEDTETQKLLKYQQSQELTLNIIDTYTKIVIMKKQIELDKQILALSKLNLDMKQRLFDAKELSKTELNDQKVEVQKFESEIHELSARLSEYLNLLSFFTNEDYDIDSFSISDIEKPDIDPYSFNDYTNTIIYDIQASQIKKKELEVKVAKRNYLPKLNMYSRYYMYGSDVRSYPKTNKDIDPSNWSIGASLNMPLFDGMKQSSVVQKAKLELQKAEVERDKAIAELKNRISTMRSNLYYIDKQIENNETIIKELTEKEKSVNRMLAKRLVSPIESNEVKINLLKEQVEYEKNKATEVATLKGLQTLTVYNKEQ